MVDFAEVLAFGFEREEHQGTDGASETAQFGLSGGGRRRGGGGGGGGGYGCRLLSGGADDRMAWGLREEDVEDVGLDVGFLVDFVVVVRCFQGGAVER